MSWVNITVSKETKRRLKHVSLATGKQLNVVADEAVMLLLDRYDLPEPPVRGLLK